MKSRNALLLGVATAATVGIGADTRSDKKIEAANDQPAVVIQLSREQIAALISRVPEVGVVIDVTKPCSQHVRLSAEQLAQATDAMPTIIDAPMRDEALSGNSPESPKVKIMSLLDEIDDAVSCVPEGAKLSEGMSREAYLTTVMNHWTTIMKIADANPNDPALTQLVGMLSGRLNSMNLFSEIGRDDVQLLVGNARAVMGQ